MILSPQIEVNEQLAKEIEGLFNPNHLEALKFIALYGLYGAAIDDIIDEPKNLTRIAEATALGVETFGHPYWARHKGSLYLVDKLTRNTYFDSVEWECAGEEWKRRDAKALSHVGCNMLFAVILIEFGEDTLRQYSLRIREDVHLRHINDKI